MALIMVSVTYFVNNEQRLVCWSQILKLIYELFAFSSAYFLCRCQKTDVDFNFLICFTSKKELYICSRFQSVVCWLSRLLLEQERPQVRIKLILTKKNLLCTSRGFFFISQIMFYVYILYSKPLTSFTLVSLRCTVKDCDDLSSHIKVLLESKIGRLFIWAIEMSLPSEKEIKTGKVELRFSN
jgi:hypothetical protein